MERECFCVFLPILSWGLARVYDCERLKHKEETESPTYHHRWIKRWMVEIRFKDSDCLVRIIRWVQGLKEGERSFEAVRIFLDSWM